MKKLLVVAALTMAAAPAMASKARMTALGNSAHLIDTTTIFVNSADVHYLGDFATIEFGTANNAAGTPHAEGGFVRSSSMGKWGAHLGRQSDTVNEFVTKTNAAIAPAELLKEQNALDLIYGTELGGQKWGFGLHYSNAKDEATTAMGNRKVSTLGGSFGVRNDIWNAYLRFGLTGKTESDLVAAGSPELEQKGLFDLGFGYWIDTLYVDAKFLTTKGTLSAGGTDTDIEKTQYSVGVTDNVKVDGGNFFYGARFANEEVKTGDSKRTVMGLPLLAGIEVDATSWMVLRGSIKQTVLLGETKDDATGTDLKTNLLNDTTVAAGAGLKFGKLSLDGTLEGSTTGKVNADTLLANASLTYMF
ncbi:hypothetical protein [Bdellovibrio bacteriovorus]|uniref:hypothetical protein n=1 Tax=Bdellovibrio bacteriovorus TaxID=959 RepID=UPI0035A89148